MRRSILTFIFATGLHTAAFFGLLSAIKQSPNNLLVPHPVINLLVENPVHSSHAYSQASAQPQKAKTAIDIRPQFLKSSMGSFKPVGDDPSPGPRPMLGEKQIRDLLTATGKTLQSFDQLASLINGHLEYPNVLAENGVQGLATLDLYFNHDALIDESKSHTFGDNRVVRGLLVRAVRRGLTDWFDGEGGRLKKDEFRDQHFRADFVVTYTSAKSTELLKDGEGSYHLIRRNLVQTCLNPTMGGLDLACVAMRVAGAVSSELSQNYKMKYHALTDQLEEFDQMDLHGIDDEIVRKS